MGILLLTPIIVILKENYKSLKSYKFNIQNIVVSIVTIFLTIELFSFNNSNFNLPTTPLIFVLILLWIVYKQGILTALIVSLFISFIAIYYTLDGIGPFSIFEEKRTTLYLQEFLFLLFIIPIFIGALLKEIRDSNKKLLELNNNLEIIVKEKTKSLIDANKKLTNLASKDSLTKIYNRRMLNEYILHESTKAKRYKKDLSLILLDIDNFKETNDTYGHNIGDEVLIKIAKIVSNNIRKSDIFGRWGGEEFIILLPETNILNASEVAENIRKKIEEHDFGKIGRKTISLGVSSFHNNKDILDFITEADNAMYKAKNSGRNKVVLS